MASPAAPLSLSRLGLGCWQFGSAGEADYWGLNFTDELASELVRKSLDNGITYFDTAEDYAKGGSESQLGRALAALPSADRAKCVVGSKILPNNCGDVRKHCEATLARLGLESKFHGVRRDGVRVLRILYFFAALCHVSARAPQRSTSTWFTGRFRRAL